MVASKIWGSVCDSWGAEEGLVTHAGQQECLQTGVVVGPHTGQAVSRSGVKLN